MKTRTDRLLVPGTIALALSLATPARGGDTEPGVWWEQTMRMEMPGLPMKMPAMKQKVCVPKNGMSEPPGKQEENCKITDLKQDGPKMSWKMACTNPTRTGEGEITQGKDSYTGVMTMHSGDGDITAKIDAKKVGGDCDAGARRKQVAAIQKQAQDQKKQAEQGQEQACDGYVETVELRLFSGPMAPCKKPDQVARVCAHISTRDGYLTFKDKVSDPEVLRIGKELCKKDPEKVRAKLCSQAATEAKGEATPRDTLDFLASNCPDETKALAQKVCAGRSFTGMPPNIRSICVQYAREELKGDKAQPVSDESEDEEPPKKKGGAAEGAKKVLKGLFGK